VSDRQIVVIGSRTQISRRCRWYVFESLSHSHPHISMFVVPSLSILLFPVLIRTIYSFVSSHRAFHQSVIRDRHSSVIVHRSSAVFVNHSRRASSSGLVVGFSRRESSSVIIGGIIVGDRRRSQSSINQNRVSVRHNSGYHDVVESSCC
jgi:hypothetical protein